MNLKALDRAYDKLCEADAMSTLGSYEKLYDVPFLTKAELAALKEACTTYAELK